MKAQIAKILAVMDVIKAYDFITSKSVSAIIDEADFQETSIDINEVRVIIHKLEHEHKCILVWAWPDHVPPNFLALAKEGMPEDKLKDTALIRRLANSLELRHEDPTEYHIDVYPQFEDVYREYVALAHKSKPQAIHLEPTSYDAAIGLLLIGGIPVAISRQIKRTGKRNESRQAQIMRRLFDSVNTLNHGVPLHAFSSVNRQSFGSTERRLVVNTISEINKKVASALGVTDGPRLIKVGKDTARINDFYL